MPCLRFHSLFRRRVAEAKDSVALDCILQHTFVLAPFLLSSLQLAVVEVVVTVIVADIHFA